MAEYMHLVGAEDVSRAAHTMRDAAQQMSSAASGIGWSLEQHQRFMDDWLIRLNDVLNPEASK